MHARRYESYLHSNLPISTCASCPLVWLSARREQPDLLTSSNQEGQLYYQEISGTTDVAIVTRASMDGMVPSAGLCVLFELKAPGNMGDDAVYEAAAQLVLANHHAPKLRPVVVLTDLRDSWRLLWLDGRAVVVTVCSSRGEALWMIEGCVQQAAQLGQQLAGMPSFEFSGKAFSLPHALADRQCTNPPPPGPELISAGL